MIKRSNADEWCEWMHNKCTYKIKVICREMIVCDLRFYFTVKYCKFAMLIGRNGQKIQQATDQIIRVQTNK